MSEVSVFGFNSFYKDSVWMFEVLPLFQLREVCFLGGADCWVS
jgi:hypothetical protein